MNELERILKIAKAERTQAELDYLENHKSELSEEQIKQLADEEAEVVVAKSPLDVKVDQLVRKDFDVQLKELSNGRLEAIVNSGQEDRHGEILSIKGLDIKKYMTNPILANGHDYSKPSVGRTHKLTKTKDGQLIAEFEFATDIEGYNEPKILDALYRKGYQFAFSIGFIPKEVDGYTYTKSEMIEFSPVLIGADANALLTSKELLKEITKKGVDNGINNSYTDINLMNIKELLAKLANKEELTIKELNYLLENKEELTKSQLKAVEEAAKDEEEKEEPKEEPKDDVAEIKESIKALTEAIAAIKVEDKPVVKDINTFNVNKGTDKEISKELKFFYYVKGLKSGNFSEYIAKAALNTTDEAAVVPPAEFIAEVERLEEQYGVAAKYATVRRSTSGAGIKYVLGDDTLEVYDTAEGVVKTSTKHTYSPLLLEWRKFAGILPINDELLEDSAIDLWNDATQRFARAFMRNADKLVFTQATDTGTLNHGILAESGTNVVTMTGDSFEDVTYDDLSKMVYGVPTSSSENGKFFLNHEIFGVISRIKDKNDRPIFQEAANGAPATILGKPYVFTEVLPKLSDDASATAFMTFGDLRYVTLGERTGMNIVIRDTGEVGDPDDNDQSDKLNLFTQDITAMRAVKRMNAVVRFPAAFSVLKTGSGS